MASSASSNGELSIFPSEGVSDFDISHEGLTKREFFAGLVLQGLVSRNAPVSPRRAARNAVSFADALLAALSGETAEDDQGEELPDV